MVRGAWRETWARLQTERPGQATIDPASLRERVDTAIDELVANVPHLLPRVEVATLSCFLHSLVPLDQRGRALGPIETWADTTAVPGARELRAELDEDDVWSRTGCPLAASFWPAKLRSGSTRHPGAMWAGAPELVTEHLTGRRAVPRNVASATGLLDGTTGAWDRVLQEALGVDEGRLPQLVDDGAELGALRSALARRWPALSRVRWVAPWGDAASSNVGVGAMDARRAALNVGTSAALRSLVPGAPGTLPRGLFRFRLFDRSLVGGQLAEGGGVLNWLLQIVRRSRDRLEAEAAALPPGAHGLTVLPWLAGQRGLEYRDAARGTVAGLSLATDAVAIYRAVAESIALSIADVDEALSEVLGRAPDILAAGGGVAKSSLVAQLVADAIGRPVSITRATEATSRGAALLAFAGRSALASERPSPGPARVVEPDPSTFGVYAAARERRRRLADRLLGD